MVFATGANKIPPLVFPETRSIQFLHDLEKMYPTANTCALVLTLPNRTTYEMWKENVESGIIRLPTFAMG